MRMVKLVQDLLTDSEDGQEVEIPLPEVDSETLQCVWDYLQNYKTGDPEKLEKPLKVCYYKHTAITLSNHNLT